jgi:hypothetical protein
MHFRRAVSPELCAVDLILCGAAKHYPRRGETADRVLEGKAVIDVTAG